MHPQINLRQRSYTKELLDNDAIPFEDIRINMREIDIINKYLGGHTITLNGFKKLLGNRKSIRVCEIGCGDGNNLNVIANWCRKNNIQFKCTGIDIKQECVDAAKKTYQNLNAEWIANDYKQTLFNTKPDIIFSSLFCHHFTNEELIEQVKWMQQNSTIGFFINDLQRNWFAYHSIKIITKIFSSSYLVKHDAPLSVARGFHKNEWQQILQQAGLKNFTIQWKWAFRYLITYNNG
ncbi:MAG TPA: methyltransferase domain-containing protein [Parafilimonas sp.]|nr:methyltransferase domain-containing protein [Parafilimonas sp.]